MKPGTFLSNRELHFIIRAPAKEWLCLKCLREGDSLDRCDKTVTVKVMDLCIGRLRVHESPWEYDTKVESCCSFSDLHLLNGSKSLRKEVFKLEI